MSKSVNEVIENALAHAYDPIKAHEYYMKTRKLKGRKKGAKVIPISSRKPKKASSGQVPPHLQREVARLKGRLHELQARLREVLQNKRETSKKSEHKTAAEKSKDARESKKYRDEHKAELAQKRKRASSKSGGGGHSGGNPISSMTETEVRNAIARTRSNLKEAVAKARAAANRGTA